MRGKKKEWDILKNEMHVACPFYGKKNSFENVHSRYIRFF
jgi:hypothetical protein